MKPPSLSVKAFAFAILGLMAGVLDVNAPAGLVVSGSLLKLNASNFPGTNGEFGAFLSTNAYYNGSTSSQKKGREDFRTFCVEKTEHFAEGESLRVTGLSTVTMNTGYHLTKEVAFLFRGFSLLATAANPYHGLIGGQTYGSTTSDANQLQNAIWFFMGQITGLTDANNKYVKAVHNNSSAVNALVNFGGVRILNLVHNGGSANGEPRQDQLYYDASSLDDSHAPVPEPMSAVVWISGIAGLLASRRRR